MRRIITLLSILVFAAATAAQYGDISDVKLNKAEDKVDVKSTPPPRGALVLFDGKGLDHWVKPDGKTPAPWKLVGGGAMQAQDGNIICFFQAADKFKARYAMLGFSDRAKLDEGTMWPVYYALTELTTEDETQIAALIKKAVS